MKSDTKKRFILYGVIILSALSVFSVQKLKPQLRSTIIDNCFDTVSEITVYSRTNKPLNKCRDYLEELHFNLSPHIEGSCIQNLNNGINTEIPKYVQDIIDFGKDFSQKNPDYFSVFLYPLEKAWDIKNNTGIIPDVESALKESDMQNQLSLGALAKGYAADRLAEILRADGLSSALINLGGNVYAMGSKPDGSGWKIGVQDPKNPDRLIGKITARNLAVVTSGDYQRYFEADGVRYHHIFDPKTGYPSDSGLRSVTVIAEDAVLADSLSTAIFVAGADKGKELLKKYNARGIMITDDTIYFSKSLEDIFKQDDFSYKYEFIY